MIDPHAASDRRLAALVDDGRHAEAAAARQRRRWLDEQVAADARMSGVLLHAAEHGDTVTVTTTSGRSHTGRVAAVGADMVVLRTAAGAESALRLSAVAVVRPDRTRAAPVAADVRRGDGRHLVDLVADRAVDRPRVAIDIAAGASPIVGRLVGAGADVATIGLDDRSGVVYVSLSSAVGVSFLESGLGSG